MCVIMNDVNAKNADFNRFLSRNFWRRLAFFRIFVANINYNPPSMQTLKDHTRRTIMDVARTAFLEDGFLKASMRGVATATGTSLGNLYNSFPSKDALFIAVVEPFTAEMEHLLESYYGLSGYDMLAWNAPENIQQTTATYLSLVKEHRDLMSDGVGFELLYTIVLEQADERPGDGQSVIGGLLSLFSLNGVL